MSSLANQNIGLLECEVLEGDFKGEKLVSFDLDGEKISLIALDENIENEKYLKVEIIEEKDDKFLVELKGETFSTPKKIWISKSLINDPK